jgi:hypothetical protein
MNRKTKAGLWTGGAIAAFFAVGAIGNATHHKSPASAPPAAAAVTATSTTAPAVTTAKPATPKPAPAAKPSTIPRPAATSKPAPTATPPSPTGCTLANADIIVRYVTPGLDANAQTLGSVHAADCTPTFDWIRQNSPTGDGDCTTAAYASDNPGYNPDAVPAVALKKVQVGVGPGC